MSRQPPQLTVSESRATTPGRTCYIDSLFGYKFGESTTTDADGRYRFRTIKPVPYPGRTPHIHFMVKDEAFEDLTTQLYIAGHPQNSKDRLYRNVGSPGLRQLVEAEFVASSSGSAELEAEWNIVVGI